MKKTEQTNYEQIYIIPNEKAYNILYRLWQQLSPLDAVVHIALVQLQKRIREPRTVDVANYLHMDATDLDITRIYTALYADRLNDGLKPTQQKVNRKYPKHQKWGFNESANLFNFPDLENAFLIFLQSSSFSSQSLEKKKIFLSLFKGAKNHYKGERIAFLLHLYHNHKKPTQNHRLNTMLDVVDNQHNKYREEQHKHTWQALWRRLKDANLVENSGRGTYTLTDFGHSFVVQVVIPHLESFLNSENELDISLLSQQELTRLAKNIQGWT